MASVRGLTLYKAEPAQAISISQIFSGFEVPTASASAWQRARKASGSFVISLGMATMLKPWDLNQPTLWGSFTEDLAPKTSPLILG